MKKRLWLPGPRFFGLFVRPENHAQHSTGIRRSTKCAQPLENSLTWQSVKVTCRLSIRKGTLGPYRLPARVLHAKVRQVLPRLAGLKIRRGIAPGYCRHGAINYQPSMYRNYQGQEQQPENTVACWHHARPFSRVSPGSVIGRTLKRAVGRGSKAVRPHARYVTATPAVGPAIRGVKGVKGAVL